MIVIDRRDCHVISAHDPPRCQTASDNEIMAHARTIGINTSRGIWSNGKATIFRSEDECLLFSSQPPVDVVHGCRCSPATTIRALAFHLDKSYVCETLWGIANSPTSTSNVIKPLCSLIALLTDPSSDPFHTTGAVNIRTRMVTSMMQLVSHHQR